MKNKNKQVLYNAVMVAVIVIMAVCAAVITKKIKTSGGSVNDDTVLTIEENSMTDADNVNSSDNKEDASENPEDVSENAEDEKGALSCTVEIRCDTVLDNMESLKKGKEVCIPADGIVLKAVTVSFSDGETAFDVLKRACEENEIQLEYSYTPAYGSYYIEGINNLYQFDCGKSSGWLYYINGSSPGCGCSSYVMSDGDVLSWEYKKGD